MNYLRVKNWSEFQHYKDRNPPWIKLHRTLLDDYEFSCLHDASKAHLMLIWVFASQCEGRIPDDPKFIMKKLGLESEPDLKTLVNHGFLVLEQNASRQLAPDASKLRLEAEAYKASEAEEPIAPTPSATPPGSKPPVEKLKKVNGHPADSGETVEQIPLCDGTEFPVKQSFVSELDRLYPAVEPVQTLREIRGWCLGNPARRKTPRGVKAFITSWFSREQDKQSRVQHGRT